MVITQTEITEILAIIKKNEECQNHDDIIRKYGDWSSSDFDEDGTSFSQIENGMVYDINFDRDEEGTLFIYPADDTLYLLSNPANAEHLRRSIQEARAGRVFERELIEA
jgi:hypothetical protein